MTEAAAAELMMSHPTAPAYSLTGAFSPVNSRFFSRSLFFVLALSSRNVAFLMWGHCQPYIARL